MVGKPAPAKTDQKKQRTLRRLFEDFQKRAAAFGLSSPTVSTMQIRQPSTAAVEPKNEIVSALVDW
jgi:hypothetical protein